MDDRTDDMTLIEKSEEVENKEYSIFEEQIARKPNRYPWTDKFIDAMHEGHWTHKEFTFQSDIHDFKTVLTEQEQDIIKKTLSAIGQVEIAVKKFWAKLGDNLPHPSLTDLGYVMANIEVIHNNAYENLLSVLGLENVFEENLKVPVIQGRINYLRKYLHKFYKDHRKQYVYSLILFTLFVENVSLFSQFYIIRWFGRFQNVLKDTNQQVRYTRLEEQIHAQVGMQLVNNIRKEHPELFDAELEARIINEAEAAFQAECSIIDWILGDYSQERINASVLKEYIKKRINDSLKEIGFNRVFTINRELKRDFEWADEELLGNTAMDFFHGRPVEYSKKGKSFAKEILFPDKIYTKTW
jgi:ribonucleoside-diphosphate reductase beta chain